MFQQSKQLRSTAVEELKCIRTKHEELRVKCEELVEENAELKKIPEKLKELLSQKNSAVEVFGDDTPSSEVSDGVHSSFLV